MISQQVFTLWTRNINAIVIVGKQVADYAQRLFIGSSIEYYGHMHIRNTNIVDVFDPIEDHGLQERHNMLIETQQNLVPPS